MKTIPRCGWARRILTAAALLALLAGCAPVAVEQSAAPSQLVPVADLAPAGSVLDSQQAGDLQAWLTCDPAQPAKGAAEMDAYLLGPDDEPVTDAQVTFDIDMTNMSHGVNRIAAAAQGDGHYVGQVHFPMAGPWRLIAIVERPGREAEQVRFDFKVDR